MILRCSVRPANAGNQILGGALRRVPRALCTPRGSMLPENWPRIARTVFTLDARNRAQTDIKARDANLYPQKKYQEYGETQMLKQMIFSIVFLDFE